MSKIIILAGLTALMLNTGVAIAQSNKMNSGRPSAVLKQDRCDELWKKAVPSGDTLAKANAHAFIANWSQVDKDNDGTLTKQEWDAACGKGMVKDTGQ
jgi:hypothetical protein